MPAYILTGTPGSGKTAILRMLEDAGYLVVEEAATDVIALGQALGLAGRGRSLASSTGSSPCNSGAGTGPWPWPAGGARSSSSTVRRCAHWR